MISTVVHAARLAPALLGLVLLASSRAHAFNRMPLLLMEVCLCFREHVKVRDSEFFATLN